MTRLENLLGAQAIALSDRIRDGDGTAPGERAALVTLRAHPDMRVAQLGEVLGLTSSGITRLVDRLVAGRLVTRSPGADGRERHVRLTRSGRTRADAAMRAREAAMAEVVAPLSNAERDQLERLLARVVGGLADTRVPALRVCRLCDRTACAANGRECPLEHTTETSDD